MQKLACILALIASGAEASAVAAQRVVLPAWVCAHPDAIFSGDFETGQAPLPQEPSHGSGGAYPGDVSRSVSIVGLGSQLYYLHVPANYTPDHSWPVMLVLHGSGGPNTSDTYAKQVRSDWSSLADTKGFIVVSPVGTDTQGGGWNAPDANGQGPSDYDIIAAAISDTQGAYNIEDSRIYAWGYSAGGEVLYDIILTGWVGLNANSFAGFAVTGAVLAGCPTYNTVQSCVPANAVRIIPLDIHIGQNDPDIPLSYPRADKAAFLAAGWVLDDTLFYTEFGDGFPPGGHTYTSVHLSQDWSELCPNAVVP